MQILGRFANFACRANYLLFSPLPFPSWHFPLGSSQKMAPPTFILNRNPVAALTIDHKVPTFDANAYPNFNAAGLPDYGDDMLSLLLQEAYRLRFIREMPQNKHLSNESHDKKIKYFLRFYDGEGYYFNTFLSASWSGLGTEMSDLPPVNEKTFTAERSEFCCLWAKPWFNFLHNKQDQSAWGAGVRDSFELLLRHTEKEVCNRSRRWHPKVDEHDGRHGKMVLEIPEKDYFDVYDAIDTLYICVRETEINTSFRSPETDFAWDVARMFQRVFPEPTFKPPFDYNPPANDLLESCYKSMPRM